jgi:hypothetical protein
MDVRLTTCHCVQLTDERNAKRSQDRQDSLARIRKQKNELRCYITGGAAVWNELKRLRMSLAVPCEHGNDLVPNEEGDFLTI